MAVKQVKKNSKISFDEFKEKVMKADLNTVFIFGAIILVLVVGMYAIFAPRTAEVIGGNPACGKIVVAADGASLRANVSLTLAGAKYFLVVDPLTKKILEKVMNPYNNAASPGRELIYLIAGKGEEAVIVGDIDPQSYGIFSQFGIKVFGGYTGKVKNVVGLYRQARVSPMSKTQVMNAPNAGGMQNGAGFDQNATVQAAFGFGEQSFICPTCNWRMKCPRQGNAYPNCPNCGSNMAQDMANQGFFGLKPGEIFAANTVPIQNDPSQMYAPQPNFWQGRDSLGHFTCPGCNWRMYSERPLGEYPRCPNCKQIMARSGVVPQNNNNQNYVPQNALPQAQVYQAPAVGRNFSDQFAGRDVFPQAQVYQAPAIQAPPIYKNSPMVHDYRGVCTNCHQILNSPAQAQAQTQAQAQNDPAGVQAAATCVLR